VSFQRRQFLRALSYAFGSSFILSRNHLAMAEQKATKPSSPAAPSDLRQRGVPLPKRLIKVNREEQKWKK